MAMATTCCLNNLNPPPPPPPPEKSHSISRPMSSNNQLVPWNHNDEKKGSWQKRCVLGVAGAAIALQMVGDQSGGGLEMGNVRFVDARKWSEERMCPQWRLNSLETVVPENLPRPPARRRWDPAALPRTAPQLRTTHITSPSARCFSM